MRAGHTEFSDTTARLIDYMEGDYARRAGRLFILDEHWTCLAALAIQDVTEEPTGADICRAYLAKEAYKTPTTDHRLGPNAGAAGGLAEAVVAGAYIDDVYREDALAYGQWFLQNVTGERHTLPKPRAAGRLPRQSLPPRCEDGRCPAHRLSATGRRGTARRGPTR